MESMRELYWILINTVLWFYVYTIQCLKIKKPPNINFQITKRVFVKSWCRNTIRFSILPMRLWVINACY